MKDLYINKCIRTLINFLQNSNVIFESFNAQHYLISMIEIRKRSVDGDGQAGALLTDLSKFFD